jgi:hypothetical protein
MAKRNPYDKYKIDPEIKAAGITYEDEDVRITVTYAGAENSRYDKMLKLRLKPYETRIRNDNFPDSEFHKILAAVYSECVVRNWESKDEEDNFVQGVYNEDGEIMPFTKENVCIGFGLGDRLFQDVIKVATNFNLFRKVQKEEDAKN